jgi:hypothetical protein
MNAAIYSLFLQEMFDEALLSIEEMLVQTSASGLTYIAEWKYGKLEHKEQWQQAFPCDLVDFSRTVNLLNPLPVAVTGTAANLNFGIVFGGFRYRIQP